MTDAQPNQRPEGLVAISALGDPACWAHLFEDAEPVDAVDGVHSRSTISTPPAPIVAAGGPADRRVLAAALMPGANGIALGTRFPRQAGQLLVGAPSRRGKR